MIGDSTITLLQRLFTLMNSAAGRHAIYSGAANSLLTLLEADSAAIFEHDEVQDLLVLATARNLSLEAQVQVMQALTRRMQSSPVWISYPQTVCNWPQQVLDEEGSLAPGLSSLPCLMTMPLRSSKGDLLGVMVAFYRDPAALNGRRQVVASLLAGLVAVSLENAELYEVERQRAEFMAEVLRSGDVLQVDQSLDSIIQQVVEIISSTLDWRTVVVVVYDYEAGERRLAGWVTRDPVFNERLERLERVEPLTMIDIHSWRMPSLRVSRSYFVDHREVGEATLDALRADRYFSRFSLRSQTNSLKNQWHPQDFLVIPLTYKGADLGWMAVDSPRDLHRPTLARVQELEIFADQLAQAVINTRLYNEAEHERLKLATVLDGISDGVLAFDLQDRLMFSNRAAEQMLGMTLPQIPGVPLGTLLIDSPLCEFLVQAGEVGVGGEIGPHTADIDLPLQNRTLSVTVTPLANTGRVVLMRDVSYFREMERLRLELLSSLSHDLKNPLTAINVTVALIERSGVLNTRQHEYVERLRSTAQRAVAMITELLDMARLESGARLPQELCLLPELIEDVVDEMRVHAEEKHITLAFQPPDLPLVSGDTVRLRQVLVNLIGNAIKYTPADGDVEITAVLDEGYIQVCVADTGVGIPDDHLPYVFDRFYRVDPRSTEGTGLGLAIVKTVIERHGGEVWVHSTVGQGSAFYFSLPVSGALPADLPDEELRRAPPAAADASAASDASVPDADSVPDASKTN